MLSHRNRLFLRHCDGGVELDPTEGILSQNPSLLAQLNVSLLLKC